ncbi:MAG: nucleoside-diphosphate kinase [Actinobacteria bacterium]|nr:nucleoside-diphosphate kinase [Actinomycetota bacterium]
MQKTLVIIKPDAVRRRLIGQIISRIEAKGLRIEKMKMMLMSRELAKRHYGEHEGKPFFRELVDFITSGDVVVMVVGGYEAVSAVRSLMGSTDPLKSSPGTIRGDFALEIGQNVVHGSSSAESAYREIELFFGS